MPARNSTSTESRSGLMSASMSKAPSIPRGLWSPRASRRATHDHHYPCRVNLHVKKKTVAAYRDDDARAPGGEPVTRTSTLAGGLGRASARDPRGAGDGLRACRKGERHPQSE